MPVTYVNIASITANGTQTGYTFSSIPQTYTDLAIRMSIRNTANGTFLPLYTYVNAFNGFLNTTTRLQGNGSTTSSSRQGVAQTQSIQTNAFGGANITANVFNNGEIYIPNYTTNAQHPILCNYVAEDNAATAWTSVMAWRQTTAGAITSITLNEASGGFFANNSTFYLYGIKNS